MWKKVLISGAVGAVILGAGGTALAASGSSSPAAASSSPSTHSGPAKGKSGAALRRTLHATGVTRSKDGSFVTHDSIRGTVTAVDSGSITVLAADNTSEKYVITQSTKVRKKGDKTPATIGTVITVGDAVGVLGTGTLTSTGTGLTATHIVDRGKPPAKS